MRLPKMGQAGQTNLLIGGVVGLVVVLTIINTMNTDALSATELALYSIIGIVVIGGFISRVI